MITHYQEDIEKYKWFISISVLSVIYCLFATQLYAQEIPNDSLNEVLEQAKYGYNNGEYTNAIRELEGVLDQFKNTEKVEALKYLAFCYINIGDETTARDYFKNVLKIVPKLELDSAAVAPTILKVFKQTKKERAYEAAMCSCFIPGWGQMLKGEDAKARMIMVTSGVTFLSSTISWVITQSKYNDYIDLGPDEIDRMDEVYRTYNRWYRTSLVASAIFLGIYAYSIYDAMFAGTTTKSSAPESKKGLSYTFNNECISINYTVSF